jgi:hypothetical protein
MEYGWLIGDNNGGWWKATPSQVKAIEAYHAQEGFCVCYPSIEEKEKHIKRKIANYQFRDVVNKNGTDTITFIQTSDGVYRQTFYIKPFYIKPSVKLN